MLCLQRCGCSWSDYCGKLRLTPLTPRPLPYARPPPPRPQDRRKEMVKTVSKLGEEGKVAIRNVRRDGMKAAEKLEKDGGVSGAAGLRVTLLLPPPCAVPGLLPARRAARLARLPALPSLLVPRPALCRSLPAPAEDQRKDLEAALQKLTDEYVKQVRACLLRCSSCVLAPLLSSVLPSREEHRMSMCEAGVIT